MKLIYPHKELYAMFIAALLNSPNLAIIQISINRQRDNKFRHSHTMDCYSVIKRKELAINATTWMNLKYIKSKKLSLKRLYNI